MFRIARTFVYEIFANGTSPMRAARTFVWDTKKVPVRGTGAFFAAFCAGFGFVERLCLALSTEFCYTGTKGRCISWRICWTV